MTEITTTSKHVQNGTELLETNFPETMAMRFRSYARKTAENFLEMARVVEEMKRVTGDEDFAKFCRLIGFDSKSGTIRKFVIMGKQYPILISHVDKLPANWTTLYEIARADEDIIEANIESGVITPKITSAELKQYLPSTNSKNGKVAASSALFGTSAKFQATVSVKLNAKEKLKLKQLIKLLSDNGVQVEINMAYEQVEKIKKSNKDKSKESSTASLVPFMDPEDVNAFDASCEAFYNFGVNKEHQNERYKQSRSKKFIAIATNTLEEYIA